MSLLKSLLLDKKLFDAQEEIETFLDEQGIEPGSVPQSIEFDKKVFEDTDQVNDFMLAHLFNSMKVEEADSKFYVNLFDSVGFIEETIKRVIVRDGITLVIGFLKPMTSDNPMLFKINESSTKLSADIPYIIELATVVDGFHPAYGQVIITKQDLISFKDNFENKVVGVDISLDFDHETREAAGWLTEVFLNDDGTTLLGIVKWTPKGALSLSDREFRYFSPEFSLNWTHPHDGKIYGPTLLGGALVNRPFLKMEAIVASEIDKRKKGVNVMETIALSDHKAKVSDFEKQISDFKLSEVTLKSVNTGLKDENVKLADELKTLKEESEKAATQAKHQKLFDEGKINAAQLTALSEGKDLLEVLSLSVKMNTEAGGTGAAVETVQLTDQEKKLCKQLDLTEEDFIKFNKGAE
jgi:phage I-like protein